MSSSTAADLERFVSAEVQRYRRDPLILLKLLREAQDRHAHVSDATINDITRTLGIPRGQVQGVVEFYAFLHRKPRGRYDVLLSDSITDHMLGKSELMDYACQRLGVSPGETRADGLVSLDNTSCTGMCDQGPAGLVNGYAITRLSRERIDAILPLIERSVPVEDWPTEFFDVRDNIHREDILLGSELSDGAALTEILDRGPDAILGEIFGSGLRGLGGAGFRTGVKWALCREAPSTERYVVCNADEGEPGTFKDRALLQSYPERLFEGMTLCARVVGARRGYLYLRGEYRYLLKPLESVLRRRREAGLLGKGILGVEGFDFDIDICLGAGAYVCGEESALIESLEGKRGVARVRPPFPATEGFKQRPTVVNNVETFVAAALIAVRGGDWFANIGTDQSKGSKLISVSGDCARPGIYEYPFGVSIRQVLEDCGAEDTQAVQVAGAAGRCLPQSEFERRIALEDVPTGGSFMVFNSKRDMLDVARNFVHFFAHESCGFCTPCRVGTSLMKQLMDKVYAGRGTGADLEEMRHIGKVMSKSSNCGLGVTAPNTVFDTLEWFPQAYERRLKSANFEPAFDLDEALAEAREITGRDDAEAHL